MIEARRDLRVMQSQRAPRATTNPYNKMLAEALAATPGLAHLDFSWRKALLGRYDVFHWHWPETRYHGSTPLKATVNLMLTALLALRQRLSRRIAVVRTVHNIELPDDDKVRLWLLRRIDKRTDYRIVINTTTPLAEGTPHSLILHGHYRDWYARCKRAPRKSGQLGTFGAIRRYKGLDSVIKAYTAAAELEPQLSLCIGGRPTTVELADNVRSRTTALPNVTLKLEFLSDDELVELATSSDLIVLAYRFMHNSGSALAALSLDRPVLVPRSPANEALADEVGADWIAMYDDELDGETLVGAWRAAATLTGSPDLSRRNWSDAGEAHLQAFRAAMALKRGTRLADVSEG